MAVGTKGKAGPKSVAPQSTLWASLLSALVMIASISVVLLALRNTLTL